MAVRIPLSYVQMVIEWDPISTMGSTPTTVLGFRGGEGLDPLELCASVVNILTSAMCDSWATHRQILRIGADEGPYAALEYAVAKQGDSTSESAPPNVCGLIKKTTALGGRSNRGRLYLPGVPEGSVDANGVVNPGYTTALLGVCNDLDHLNEELDAFVGWVILHDEESPQAETPTFIAQHVPSVNVATQRRRQRR